MSEKKQCGHWGWENMLFVRCKKLLPKGKQYCDEHYSKPAIPEPTFTLAQVKEIIVKGLEVKMFAEFGWNCVCYFDINNCVPHLVLTAIRETEI